MDKNLKQLPNAMSGIINQNSKQLLLSLTISEEKSSEAELISCQQESYNPVEAVTAEDIAVSRQFITRALEEEEVEGHELVNYFNLLQRSDELELALLTALAHDMDLLNKFQLEHIDLKEDTFFLYCHQQIFQAIVSFKSRNPEATALTLPLLESELNFLFSDSDSDSLLNKALEVCEDIFAKYFSIPYSTIKVYAYSVIKLHAVRSVFFITKELRGDVIKPNGQPLSEALAKDIFKLQEVAKEIDFTDQSIDYVPDTCDFVTNLMSKLAGAPMQAGSLIGDSCGYEELDKCLSGLQKGRLYVVGSRPSVGKTTFALNLALNMALNPTLNKPVLFFELEMGQEEIYFKVISNLADTPEMDFRYHRQSNEAKQKVFQGLKDLSRVDGNGNQYSMLQLFSLQEANINTIESYIAEYAKRFGGLSGVFIDYIQLLNSGEEQNRYITVNRALGKVARSLKRVASRLNVPVVVLSQLNRAIEARKFTGDTAPQLSDIRGSGEIELHSDVVMFLTSNDKEDSKGERKVTVHVRKNRSGPVGNIDLKFNPSIHKFFDKKSSAARSKSRVS